MHLRWTRHALADLARLYDFLATVNPLAAAKVVQSLTSAPAKLLEHPRLGVKLSGFANREVRRFLVKQYEMRYEIKEDTIYLLRIWHTREHR
jgi:plasmid stabilization system protein ParE